MFMTSSIRPASKFTVIVALGTVAREVLAGETTPVVSLNRSGSP